MAPALLDKIGSKVKKVLPHSDSDDVARDSSRSPPPVREHPTSSSIFKCRSGTQSSTPASSITNVPSTLGRKGSKGSRDSRGPTPRSTPRSSLIVDDHSTLINSEPGSPNLPHAAQLHTNQPPTPNTAAQAHAAAPNGAQRPRQPGPPDPRPMKVPAPTVTQDFDSSSGRSTPAHKEESTLHAIKDKARECKEKLTPNFLQTGDCSVSGSAPCSQLFGMFKALASEDSRDGDTSDSDVEEAPRRRRPEKRRSHMSQVSTMSSGQTTDEGSGDADSEKFEHLHRSESEPQLAAEQLPEPIRLERHAASWKRHASVSTSQPAEQMAHFDENDPEVQRWLRETLGPVQLNQLNMRDTHYRPQTQAQMRAQRASSRPKPRRRPTDVPEGNEDEPEPDSEDAMIAALNDANPPEGVATSPRVPPEQIADLALAEMAEQNAEEGEQERRNREELRAKHGHRTTLNPLPSTEEISAEERQRFSRSEVPEAEKLRVIREEFGDIASAMVDAQGRSEPERILAESQGSLFRGVMMLGNLCLTTHRLLFHALLPPDEMITQGPDFESVDDNEAAALRARPDVIQAGSVTLHQSGLFSSKKRVWMEITPEMITCYPSADEAGKVRPLFSILISSIYRLKPLDPKEPVEFYITYDGADGIKTLHFTVDNTPSSMRWRRTYEAVLFCCASQRFRQSHRRDAIKQGLITQEEADAHEDDGTKWTLLRCCVPLDKAELRSVGDYHHFATLVNMDVLLQADTQVSWRPEEIATGNFAAYGDFNIEGDEDGMPDKPPPTEKEAMPSDHEIHPDHSGPVASRQSSQSSQTPSAQSAPTYGTLPDVPYHHDTARASTVPDMRVAMGAKPDPPATRHRSRTLMSRITGRPDAIDAIEEEGSHDYLDTDVPPGLQRGCDPSDKGCADIPQSKWAVKDNKYQFLVAILNDQEWFVDALKAALPRAHERHYVRGALPEQMAIDVGGCDCMSHPTPAHDDEDEDAASSSEEESDSGDEDTDPHRRAERKRERKLDRKTEPVSSHKARIARAAAKTFGIRERDGIWLKRAYVQNGVVAARGHIIISPKYTCFWRRAHIGSDIKYRFATADVKGAVATQFPLSPRRNGMALKINGQPDLKFEFWSEASRDAVVKRVNRVVAQLAEQGEGQAAPGAQAAGKPEGSELTQQKSATSSSESRNPWEAARNLDLTQNDFQVSPQYAVHGDMRIIEEAARFLAPPPDMLVYPKALNEEALAYMPFVANRPWSSGGANVRLTPRKFTMLTIGSRGDVQPYIALSLRLMQDGHKCIIVTHAEFKEWIEGYGIEHRQAGGDPTALMKISQDHKMLSPGFFKEALGTFRQWLDDLLNDAWDACQDADVLIESPSAMAGIHISEALGIPYFRAFTMPWTRTSLYPQAFMVPAFEMGPQFNYSTYVLFDNIMWKASARQINRWRKKRLGLGATDQSSLSVSKVPFLYNFSPAVVPKPLDWYDDITITGYWELENSDMDWSPPDDLLAFMQKAKDDKVPIVYIGFGSIVVPDPGAVSRGIIKGVEKAGVRAIIAKGWSARSETGEKEEDDVVFPASCYSVDKIPHGWLFPKIDAAMHHGGAGTTGASLRNGLPTIIKPWFGDQHFWALRVTKMGCGVKLASLKSDEIAEALKKVTGDRVMIEKSRNVGIRIRQEKGTDTAVQAIHANIIRAAKDRQKLKKEDDVVKEHKRASLNLGLF